MMDKQVIIIAGPNGAGKTTFAREYLLEQEDFPVFLNADLIGIGKTPFQAGRLMLKRINRLVQEEQSFAFETTLSGRSYIKKIRDWRRAGYSVGLIYLSLDAPETAIRRVQFRMRQGGHSIPEPIIRRRFDASIRNFKNIYRHCVEDWYYYDNSGAKPILLEKHES